MTSGRPEFVIVPNLPLGTRLATLAILAAGGLVLQIAFSLFWGWLLFLAAALLAATRGESRKPRLIGPGEWQTVTIDELKQIERTVRNGKRALKEAGVFHIASPAGCAMGFLLVMGTAAVTVLLAITADAGLNPDTFFKAILRGGSTAFAFAVDAITVLVPIWLFGRVGFWEPPDLRTRARQLLSIYQKFSSEPVITFQPSLMVRKTESGSVPVDCRLTAHLKDSDPDFMGVQVQTSINRVQGTAYPYTYCVLVAKPAFRLKERVEALIELPPPGGFRTGRFADVNEKREALFGRFQEALVELKTEGEVDIAVVRQNTKGSGYRTSQEEAAVVFSRALELAKRALAETPPDSSSSSSVRSVH